MEVFLYSMREYILDSVGSTAYWVTLWWGRCRLAYVSRGYNHMHPSG